MRAIEDFTALHSRRLDADGCPALREDVLNVLNRREASVGDATPTDPPTLASSAALARLTAEHPQWAECIDLCCVQGLTQRQAAAQLGVSQPTVHDRLRKGMTFLEDDPLRR